MRNKQWDWPLTSEGNIKSRSCHPRAIILSSDPLSKIRSRAKWPPWRSAQCLLPSAWPPFWKRQQLWSFLLVHLPEEWLQFWCSGLHKIQNHLSSTEYKMWKRTNSSLHKSLTPFKNQRKPKGHDMPGHNSILSTQQSFQAVMFCKTGSRRQAGNLWLRFQDPKGLCDQRIQCLVTFWYTIEPPRESAFSLGFNLANFLLLFYSQQWHLEELFSANIITPLCAGPNHIHIDPLTLYQGTIYCLPI